VALDSPLSIGTLTVNGRLYKSATGETRATDDGFVTDELLEFYEPMLIGGVPLIITGNAYISPGGKGVVREIGADSDAKIPGLSRLADLVHRYGSTVFGQINHCGRQVAKHDDPVSASDVREPTTGCRPRPLRKDEIPQVTAQYAAAAERLQQAGFDRVQIHMAHGYLVSQFLTPHTNRRTDEYGRSFDNRVRFAREVLAAVRNRVGPEFPVIAKINGHDKLALRDGLGTEELVRVARVLEGDGLDAVEISAAHYESGLYTSRGSVTKLFSGLTDGVFKEAPAAQRKALAVLRPALTVFGNILWRYSEGFNVDFAREFTNALAIPVICVGGWQHRDAMVSAMNSGGCDAVSAARTFIADPLFFKHAVERGEPMPACTFCNACVAYTGEAALTCFEPLVRAKRDQVLRDEIDWYPRRNT
jgi:2,4-dienoyl-CoA reductase-like NADH-dependent reductase (Old Yellow Enzyme family)